MAADPPGEGFLTSEQQRRYGRYAGDPDQAQLDRYFHLDAAARELVDIRRGEHNRLGFAVQIGTVRFLGTFLADLADVPWAVAAHLAAQLGIADPGVLKQCAAREGTNRLHAGEIQHAYGYRDYANPAVQQDLIGWLEAGARLASVRPGCCSTWPPHGCARPRCCCPARQCWPGSSPRFATRLPPGCGRPSPPSPTPGSEPGSRLCSSSRRRALLDAGRLRRGPTSVTAAGLLGACTAWRRSAHSASASSTWASRLLASWRRSPATPPPRRRRRLLG